MEQLQLREVLLRQPGEKGELFQFLRRHNLHLEDDICFAVELIDCNERIVACGASNGSFLKCFAVEESLQGYNVLAKLLAPLMHDCLQNGNSNPFVITRPQYEPLFLSCGFSLVAKTEDVVMLEHIPNGIERFASSLIDSRDAGKKAGAIVLNANPFTKGHRYLTEWAARQCQVLHLFLVEEERSIFPFEDRLALVREGTADLSNVRIHKGGPYIISSATFPRYFLKSADNVAMIQATLDATVFAERIAPVMGITTRFVGTEPNCALTSDYNQALQRILPPRGVGLLEIPRLTDRFGTVISASYIRQVLSTQYEEAELEGLLPPCTLQYLKSRKGAEIIARIRQG